MHLLKFRYTSYKVHMIMLLYLLYLSVYHLLAVLSSHFSLEITSFLLWNSKQHLSITSKFMQYLSTMTKFTSVYL